ncbi:MAG: MFS transporter [Anaerolineae bacterium]
MSQHERGFSPILRNRYFLFLWIAQALSQTAYNGIHFVQMIMIERLTRSSGHMGLMILAFSLPGVLFSTVAGVVVDRLPNKLVMVTSNGLRVLTAVSYIVFLHTLGGLHLLAVIYAITFIASTIGQFFAPAELATIPLLVGGEGLLAANSLFNLTLTASQVVGFILLFPSLVKLGGQRGLDLSFAVIALMYAAAMALVALLPRDVPGLQDNPQASPLKRAWAEVREGWAFVSSHSSIYLAVLQLTLVAALVMVMAMLAPGFATRVLGMQPEDAVYIFAPAGVGIFLATFLVGRFGHHFSRESLINAGLMTMGLTLGALAFVGRVGGPVSMPLLEAYPEATVSLTSAMMGLAFFLGLELGLISIPAQTILQERSPLEIRGRVLAVQFMLANLVGIPPLLFIGALADRIGIPRVTLLISVGVLLAGGISIYYAQKERN